MDFLKGGEITHFSHSKPGKQPFFARIFKIQEGQNFLAVAHSLVT